MANNKDFKVKNGIQPTVYHEGLGTVTSGSVGYYLAGASYDSKSFSVSSQETNQRGITFKSDGTEMYVVGLVNDTVYQYTLSTAWDISTASYSSKSFSVASQDTSPTSIQFKSDGTKMFMVGQQTSNVRQYSLSSAWDVSTASYDSVSFSVATQVGGSNVNFLFFSADGTKMYAGGNTNQTIFQYSLSSAWDLSTASYASKSFSVASQEGDPRGIFFKSDGSVLFVVGINDDEVLQYSLSTSWDVSTASFDNISFSVASQDSTPVDVHFSSDGEKMFISGVANQSVYQYSTVQTTNTLDLSTGSVFEITPTSDIQIGLSNPADSGTVSQATLLLDGAASAGYDLSNPTYTSKSFSVASQDSTPRGSHISLDGTKLFLVGASNTSVFQYNLSTPFDLSSTSYSGVSLNVSSQDSSPMDVSFSTDGTIAYVMGYANQRVYQYTLSTAFDLSTAVYASKSSSVSAQTTQPMSLSFKGDGTSLFVLGNIGDRVYQYTLSTAWDISTASYASKSFSIASQDAEPIAVRFNSSGDKMYYLGFNTDTVYQYTLSTAWDVSTASYDSVSFSFNSQDTTPFGFSFGDSGISLIMTGYSLKTLFQYSTATPATITYDTAIEWPSGTAPTSPAIGDTDVLTFSTTDGGTSYQAVQAINGAK
jgi:hypothetical protein